MKDKKKLIGFIFLGVVGLMLVVNLVFFAKDDKAKEVAKAEPVKETVVEEEVVEEKDPLEETKKATTYLYRDHIAAIGTGDEYDEKKTAILEDKLLKLAETGDYGLIMQESDKLIAENTFSKGENLDVAGILYDANMVADAFTKNDPEIFGTTVAGSKTPEMMVISTMFADNFARRYIIEDVTSLAPIGFESVQVGERREFRNPDEAADEELFYSRNIAQDIFAFNNDTNTVYAFDMTVANDGGLPLTAYVREDLYGKLYFYGMYAPDDFKTYEKNLEWWMQQDVLYENAEKAQDKAYEQNAEDGVITNEQMDKLFESGW